MYLLVYHLVYHASSAVPAKLLKAMAGTTGLEPAASAVTGQRSNQLNYVPFSIFIKLCENPRGYQLPLTSNDSPLSNRFPYHVPEFHRHQAQALKARRNEL